MVALAGRLVFYRWPEKEASLAHAPGGVSNALRGCGVDIDYFIIPHGVNRCSNDPNGPEQATACAQYNLSAPTPEEATAAAQSLRRLFDQGPRSCKPDDAGTMHACCAWVEGGSPLQPVTDRPLELQDLVEQGELEVVQALRSMVVVMGPFMCTRGTGKRRRDDDERNVARALDALLAGRGRATNALFRPVLPVQSQEKLLQEQPPAVPSFAQALLHTERERGKAVLRHGFAVPGGSLEIALRFVLEELMYEAGSTLRSGPASCPRTAYLCRGRGAGSIQKATTAGRPTKKKRKSPQVSKLVMMKDRAELQCVLPWGNGKLRAMWIARYDVVAEWTFGGGWRGGVKSPFELGVLRMVASASPCGRQVSVAPPVDVLPGDVHGREAALDGGRAVRIITVLLVDLHEAHLIHAALQRAMRATVPAIPETLCLDALQDASADFQRADVLLRLVLGLDEADGDAGAAGWAVETAVGAPRSEARRVLLARVEEGLGVRLTPLQRGVALDWK